MVKHTQISQQQQTNCFSVIVDREVLTSLPPPPPPPSVFKNFKNSTPLLPSPHYNCFWLFVGLSLKRLNILRVKSRQLRTQKPVKMNRYWTLLRQYCTFRGILNSISRKRNGTGTGTLPLVSQWKNPCLNVVRWHT